MFSRTNHSASGRSGSFSVIGPDVVVTGDLVTGENLQVDGRIDGDVRCAQLIQGASGTINGNVVAEEARLAGTVDGTLTARVVVLETTARLTGEVSYATLSIENGARVDGKFAHREDAEDRRSLSEISYGNDEIRAQAAE